MGCHVCEECGDKFEADEAEEYAAGIYPNLNLDLVDYDTCPGCLEKFKREEERRQYNNAQHQWKEDAARDAAFSPPH